MSGLRGPVLSALVTLLSACAGNPRSAAGPVRATSALAPTADGGDRPSVSADEATLLRSGIAIAAGESHTCAIVMDRTVRCWGQNSAGQLGAGDDLPHSVAVAVTGVTGAVGISAGGNETCAWLRDGTVRCWGNDISTASRVEGASDVSSVSIGDSENCALFANSSLRCWRSWKDCRGADENPTCTPEWVDAPQELSPVAGLTRLAPSGEDLCGVRADGTVQCSGAAAEGVKALRDVAELAEIGGAGVGCARSRLGTVQCWGVTPEGLADLKRIVEIGAGSSHFCARRQDGTVWCWGTNDKGELGDGTTQRRHAVVQVRGLEGATHLAVGGSHTCATKQSGPVVCWGALEEIEGHPPMSLVPIKIDWATHVEELFASRSGTCARGSTGVTLCSGNRHFDPYVLAKGASGQSTSGQLTRCARLKSGRVLCGEASPYRRIEAKLAEVPGLTGVVEIAGGDDHTCARLTNGDVRCWGDNSGGQLGVYTPPKAASGGSSVPVIVTVLRKAVSISASAKYTCAVLSDATARCWGLGPLGDDVRGHARKPVVVKDLRDATGIAAGETQACAWSKDGRVRCWEDDEYSQLRGAAAGARAVPALVAGLTDVVQVVAGEAFTCALRAGGTVACWGKNDRGQIGGAGAGVQVDVPLPVPGLEGVTALAAGSRHVCARGREGGVWCWGDDAEGQLGTGARPCLATPTEVRPLAVGVETVSYGVYAPASEGQRLNHKADVGYLTSFRDIQVLETTREVSAQIGTHFGGQFRVTAPVFGEPVTLTVRIVHPPMVDPKTGPTSSQTWQDTFYAGVTADRYGRRFEGWGFDAPWTLVAGDYAVQLLLKDKLLAEERFHIAVPAEGAQEPPVPLDLGKGSVDAGPSETKEGNQ